VLEIIRWLLKRVLLPFIVVWLVLSIILFLFAFDTGAGVIVLVQAASGIILLIALFLFPYALYSFYQNRIRRTYPSLELGSLSAGSTCPLCKELIRVYDQSGSSFLLLPYAFPEFRHYEQGHSDIARDVRNVRLSLTAQLYVGIIAFAIIIAASSPSKFRMANGDLLIVLALFLVPFLSIISIALIVLYLIFRRKLRGPS
jgi:hypothetical protein